MMRLSSTSHCQLVDHDDGEGNRPGNSVRVMEARKDEEEDIKVVRKLEPMGRSLTFNLRLPE